MLAPSVEMAGLAESACCRRALSCGAAAAAAAADPCAADAASEAAAADTVLHVDVVAAEADVSEVAGFTSLS